MQASFYSPLSKFPHLRHPWAALCHQVDKQLYQELAPLPVHQTSVEKLGTIESWTAILGHHYQLPRSGRPGIHLSGHSESR